MGYLRSCYEAECRFYRTGPTGRIRFYFVPETNPYFQDLNLFWPKKECLQHSTPTPLGENVEAPRPWYRGDNLTGLDGTPVGNPEDWIGEGTFDPGYNPTCEVLFYRGRASLAIAAASTHVYGRGGSGPASLATSAPSQVSYVRNVAGTASLASEAAGFGSQTYVVEGIASLAVQAVGPGDTPECQCCGGDCMPADLCISLITGEEECECLFPGLACGIEDYCAWKIRVLYDRYRGAWYGTSPGVEGCIPAGTYKAYCHTDEIEPGVNWYFTVEHYVDDVLIHAETMNANTCDDPFVLTGAGWSPGGDCGGLLWDLEVRDNTGGLCINPTPDAFCLTIDTPAGCGDECEPPVPTRITLVQTAEGDVNNYISGDFAWCEIEYHWEMTTELSTTEADIYLVRSDTFEVVCHWHSDEYTGYGPGTFTQDLLDPCFLCGSPTLSIAEGTCEYLDSRTIEGDATLAIEGQGEVGRTHVIEGDATLAIEGQGDVDPP